MTVAIASWLRHLRVNPPLHLFDPAFFILFSVYDYRLAICAFVILACAALVHAHLSFRRILRWFGEHPFTVAATSAVVMCLGALFIYQNFPLSTDEYAPFFQSQALAAGRLTGQIPPTLLDWVFPRDLQPGFFNVSAVSGRVASAYWPSFALILTPFMWLGIPWACNPLISACTLLGIHRLALRLFDDVEAAGLAVLLTVASPVFFADGISYYSMPAHLLANTVFALLLIEPTVKRTFAAGIVGSIALTLHNPFPHLLFAIPWGVWILTRQRSLRLVGALAAGYVPLCLLLGVGWIWFLQDLVREGQVVAHVSATADRIGSLFIRPYMTTVIRRLAGVSKLCLWAVPGLPILALAGAWKWRREARCQVLFASAVITLVGYLFFPLDGGHGWGFRYFHSVWLVLPVLAAGALTPGAGTQPVPRRVALDAAALDDVRAFVTACALVTLLIAVPLSAGLMHDFINDKRAQEPAGPTVGDRAKGRQVVFITVEHTLDAVDLVQNDPFLRRNAIRMVSRGSTANERLMREYFPGYRRFYADRRGEVWTTVPSQ